MSLALAPQSVAFINECTIKERSWWSLTNLTTLDVIYVKLSLQEVLLFFLQPGLIFLIRAHMTCNIKN